MSEILTRRALNRALLARQMLLRREETTPTAVIEHLVGLQAQQARPPFVGLWSRIAGFRREDLHSLVHGRQAVRATMMRATIHLMSRRDYLAFRPVIQPALTGGMQAILQGRTGTFNTDAVLREARRLFAERPRTFNELRADLIALFPDADERAMGYFVRTQIPLVTIPAEHGWSYRADACFGLAEDWLGEPLPPAVRPHNLVLRYLAAFGPASAADVGAWSALRGLTPVLEDLRPQLRIFRDERKRELFDLPDGPRPLEDTPAPARFVADFDNLVLSHADRSRVIADEHRKAVVTKNGLVLPTILVDGFVAGTWKVTRTRKTVTLTVTPFSALPTRAREELAAESGDLLRFLEPDAPTTDLVFEAR